jgi:hypothetical protein
MTYGLQDSQNVHSEKEKINSLFEQYKKEMLYLRNFSERTLRGYQEVFNRWQRYVGEMPTEKNLSRFVIGMREAGLNTTTCNISSRVGGRAAISLQELEVVFATVRDPLRRSFTVRSAGHN